MIATDHAFALLAAVPLPAVLIGAEERILAMNAPAIELFGTDGAGRHYVTVLRQPALMDCVEAALKRGVPGRARYLDQDVSRDAIYRVTARPVAPPAGPAALVVLEDMTETERAGQMRRDFVANVSHELKTPLTALLGFIETLRGAAREDPAARERFLSIMANEAERMNRLVSDLLSLSRVESAERQRPTDRVPLDEILASTVLALRPMAEEAGVTLQTEHAAERPDGPFVVAGDGDQLQQVLTNLLENAIKYGGAGGRVTVRLARRERDVAFRGPAIQLDVTDYGEGFDPIHIPRLTERFYRVDAHRSRQKGGTGLGLAIAKHIVNRHRGRFRIESAPGEGATFTVLLPAL